MLSIRRNFTLECCLCFLNFVLLNVLVDNNNCGVDAHVALTYPPARKYDLDFLDNIRTPSPCGMPKGGKRTSLVSGSAFNVTWHLAYPHRGGYKLELLNDQGKPWMDLTPVTGNTDFVQSDPTAQQHLIRLPRNLSCLGCTIRLKREATEWANNYTFWSCAEIDIVEADEYAENCLGHGQLKNGICVCRRLFSGPRCQYRDECWEDADCGDNGKCVDIDATSYPKKQCYCKLGWFGHKCDKESAVKSMDIDVSHHQKKVLSEDFTLFWTILPSKDEIEIVMQVKTTTYASLGWRPKEMTSACKAFPIIGDNIVEESASEVAGVAEPEAEAEPVVNESLHAELVSNDGEFRSLTEKEATLEHFKPHKGNVTEIHLEDEPVPEDVVAGDDKAKPVQGGAIRNESHSDAAFGDEDYTTEPEPVAEETAAESNGHHVTVELTSPRNFLTHGNEGEDIAASNVGGAETAHDGEVNYGFEPHEDGQVEYTLNVHTTPPTTTKATENRKYRRQVTSNTSSTLRSTSEPSSTSKHSVGQNSTASRSVPKARVYDEEPKPEPGPEPEPELTAKPKPSKSYVRGPYTPKLDFHPMDCTDIVTGMARGTYSRVMDQYTRDRSTPRKDAFWGGEDSLTSATGFEKDGVTTIVFRRRLEAVDETDHSFVKGQMHVIWAKGQETDAYVHSPPSGLERRDTTPSEPNFYRQDELKYHGHRSQRGVSSIDFFDESQSDKPNAGNARGEFKIPKSCSVDDCEYRATWELIPSKDEILFSVSTNNSDKWTGIGFSEDTKMPSTDAILGWVDDSGRTFVMDTWIDGYNPPVLDKIQDVYGFKGSKVNGRVTLMFKRKRDTGDSANDLAFSDNSCLFLVFPHNGGVFNAVNKKIRQHASTPLVSDAKVCIEGGAGGLDEMPSLLATVPEVSTSIVPLAATVSSTPQTVRSAYLVAIRLPNQTLDDAIERGIDFKMLIKEHLKIYMTQALNHIKGFERIDVTALESEKNESRVVAKLRVFIDSDADGQLSDLTIDYFGKVREIKKALNESIAKGRVGRLLVDPAYLVVQPPAELDVESMESEPFDQYIKESRESNEKILLYVLIAAVAALGLLFVILIICTICRNRTAKKMRVSKARERLIAGGGWKDYAAAGSEGYGYENFGRVEETPKIHKQPVGSSNGTSRSGGGRPHSSNGHSRGSHGGPTADTTRSLHRNPRGGGTGSGGGGPAADRTGHYSRRSESLPRPNGDSGGHERGSRPSSAASLHPQGQLQPDFYFMPSQRRYSGEVVRVYVDYNNPNYTGK